MFVSKLRDGSYTGAACLPRRPYTNSEKGIRLGSLKNQFNS